MPTPALLCWLRELFWCVLWTTRRSTFCWIWFDTILCFISILGIWIINVRDMRRAQIWHEILRQKNVQGEAAANKKHSSAKDCDKEQKQRNRSDSNNIHFRSFRKRKQSFILLSSIRFNNGQNQTSKYQWLVCWITDGNIIWNRK